MNDQETHMDILNSFLFKLAKTENVGVRRKVVVLERFVKKFKTTLTQKLNEK